jgi:hypothetical protein
VVSLLRWQAVASLELKLDQYFVNGKHTLKVPDIQSLVLWVLGEAVSPKWIFVKVRAVCVPVCKAAAACSARSARCPFAALEVLH